MSQRGWFWIGAIVIGIVFWVGIGLFVANAFAVEGTPDLAAIKEAAKPQAPVQPVVQQAKTYEIPIYQNLPKKDGTGEVEVYVGTVKVTKAQLTQQIAQFNARIANEQKQIEDLQKQLDAIIAKEAQ